MKGRHAALYLMVGEQRGFVPAIGGAAPGDAAEGSTLVAIVDYADETHVCASLPAVRGTDGARLRRRRLEREFPSASLRALLPVRKRPRDGVADVVMIAVAAGAELDAQLEALGRRHALRAVTTPSLLVAEWLRRARLSPALVLIVLPTPAGLRLVFVENGKPTLSRLMPPLSQGGTAIEIARTIQYLQNTQRVDRTEPLELWFWGIDDRKIRDCLPEGVPHRLGATPHVVGLPDPERDGFQALVELATEGTPGVQLGADALRLGWFARETARWAKKAAGVLVFACVLGAIGLHWRASVATTQAATMQARSAGIAAEQSGLEADLAARGISLEDLRVLPDTEQALQSSGVGLPDIFGVVARGFAADAAIHVTELAFDSAPASSAVQPVDASCEGEPLPPGAATRVAFTLTDALAVRRRADALTAVRTALPTLAPWEPTAGTAQLGARESVTVAADSGGPSEAREWTACLFRGAAP